MGLIKTSILSGIGVITRIIVMFFINKIFALYVGPAGYALIGQFQNFVQIVATLASGGINSGVTKYTAEYKEQINRLNTLWGTSATIMIIVSLLVSAGIALYNDSISELLFKNTEGMDDAVLWFALSIPFFVGNGLILAILNGRRLVHLYVACNIIGSFLSLFLILFLTTNFKLYGAIIGIATYQSASFLISLVIITRQPWFNFSHFTPVFDYKTAKKLLGYSAMTIATVACTPVAHLYIREHLGETLGWGDAGLWEAMIRLSTAYLLLFTATLSVYYLPKFSELSDPNDIRVELIHGLKWIIPAVMLSASAVYLTREYIIEILFSPQFTGMADLFAWQMIGDVLKTCSWIFSYLMLSKAMFKQFILCEILFSSSFVAFSVFFVELFGLQGMSVAHAVNYLFYLSAVVLIMRKYIRKTA